MASQQALRAQARRQMREELNKLTRASATSRGYFPPSWGPDGMRTGGLASLLGGIDLPYGQVADEATLDKFIAMRGGLGVANAPRARRPGAPPVSLPKPAKDEPTALETLLAKIDESSQKAFDRNEARDKEIRGLRQGMYDRTMGEIDNFGKASSADLEQRAAESFGAIQANLSARGLGNSTIVDAFRGRNASDLAREQQRLSEMVSNRRLTNDQALTTDTANFIERQDDVAPNPMDYASLLMQYGQAGQGKGYADVQAQIDQLRGDMQQRYSPLYSLPNSGGFSAQSAGNFQQGMNNAFAPVTGYGGQQQYQQQPQYEQQQQVGSPVQGVMDWMSGMFGGEQGPNPGTLRRHAQEAKIAAVKARHQQERRDKMNQPFKFGRAYTF